MPILPTRTTRKFINFFSPSTWWWAYLVKMLPAPFCGVFAGMAVKYTEVTLPFDTCKINYERMGIFHRPTSTSVF